MNDDTLQTRLGVRLVEWLRMHKQRNGRYATTWGDKTPTGLGASLLRIVEEEKAATHTGQQ